VGPGLKTGGSGSKSSTKTRRVTQDLGFHPRNLYLMQIFLFVKSHLRGMVGRVDAYRPEGCGFDSCSSRHVGTLGKSFALSCLWLFGVKLRHSAVSVLCRERLRVVVDLKRRYRNSLNE